MTTSFFFAAGCRLLRHRPWLLVFVALCLAPAGSVTGSPMVRARYLMGTVCEISIPRSARAGQQLDHAFEEIDRVERLISTWRPESALSRLNSAPAGSGIETDPELVELLDRSLQWSARTGFAFNPFVGQLVSIWKTRQEGALPEQSAVARAAADGAIGNVTISGPGSITRMSPGTFEEGAFGKGYALDRAVQLLKSEGVKRAQLNFGGQIASFGTASDAELVIADPSSRDRAVAAVRTRRLSVSTSSGSEQTFEVSGKVFSHIFDPSTGMALPPRGSVSVFADSAYEADVLSTALYVMGWEAGLAWADAHGVSALFLTPLDQSENVSPNYQHEGRSMLVFRSAAFKTNESLRVLQPEFKLKD